MSLYPKNPFWLSPASGVLHLKMPLHNRYESLQVEPNRNNGSSILKVLQRLSSSMPHIKTASVKKKGWVIVI